MIRSKILLTMSLIIALVFSIGIFDSATANANRKLLLVKSDMYKARIITGNISTIRVAFTNKSTSLPIIFQIEGLPITGLAPEETKYVDLRGNTVYYIGLSASNQIGAYVEINVSDGSVVDGW